MCTKGETIHLNNTSQDINSPLLSILKDVCCYVPSKIIPALGGFIGIAIYTRFLNPKEYGQYVLIFTTIQIIASTACTWIDKSALRYFQEHKSTDSVSCLQPAQTGKIQTGSVYGRCRAGPVAPARDCP